MGLHRASGGAAARLGTLTVVVLVLGGLLVLGFVALTALVAGPPPRNKREPVSVSRSGGRFRLTGPAAA